MISWLDLWPPLHLPVEVYKIGTCRNVPSIVTTQPPAPIPDLGTYNFRDWGARLEASSSGLSRFFWSRREFFGASFAWGRLRPNFDKPSMVMTSRVDSLLRSKKNLKNNFIVIWYKVYQGAASKSWSEHTTCTWRAASKNWSKYTTDKSQKS